MALTQRQVFEAMDLVTKNAREVLEISLAADDEESLYATFIERFGITLEQADVVGSFSFKRMTARQRERISAGLAAADQDPA